MRSARLWSRLFLATLSPGRARERTFLAIREKARAWCWVLAVALILNGGTASGQTATPRPAAKAGHDLGEIGAKLSNPTSDVWALFTELDLTFSDGDLNQWARPG